MTPIFKRNPMKMSLPAVSIFFIILVNTLASANINWGKNHWKSIIEADAKGYYAYLPAIFIYNDLHFGFFDKIEKEKYFDKNLYYDYRYTFKGKVINKYYCGTALVEMPFFLIAHFLSYISQEEMDGYSKYYPIGINIAAIFYLFIGLIYLNLLLKEYAIPNKVRALTLIAIAFGTNLFYYVIGEPGVSHIFSFTLMSMFFYYAKLYFSHFNKKHILILSILLGIIILIRPLNGIVLLTLPFFAGNLPSLKKGILLFFNDKTQAILSLTIFFAIVSIQLIIYKISTGHFFVYSYGNEGFNFSSPHIIDILFSYKKGLFLYTPLLLLSLAGGVFLFRSSPYLCYTWFGFFFLLTYFLSSWWNWYYGGSFSSRVYVEFIPLFAILLAMAINNIHPKLINRIYITLVVMLVMICQIQTYQYRYNQIHWSDMTKEKYWSVFLRIDQLIK